MGDTDYQPADSNDSNDLYDNDACWTQTNYKSR